MRTLFFDTETTGLPVDHVEPGDPRQARLVQLAVLLHDSERREVAAVDLIVKPDIPVPTEAAKIHGITTERALAFGVAEKAAVGMFARMLARADAVVAHNVTFDRHIIDLAAERAGFRVDWRKVIRCTCDAAAPIVNLPPTDRMKEFGHADKPKAPKLEECVKFLFGEELVGAHTAIADTRAAARVYYELLNRGCWADNAAA